MPAGKGEQVLGPLKAVLQTISGAEVERNSVLPEKIPGGGLIILRDGDPGEPEQALSGFGNAYYQHAAGGRSEPERLAFGLTYGPPEAPIEAVAGAPAIKSATLTRCSHSRVR